MSHCTRALLAFLIAGLNLHAADWPGWRGPDHTGVSQESGLLKAWPDGGPARVWLSQEVGLGYSGMAVVGDSLYTMGSFGDREHLVAINVADGSRRWSVDLGEVLRNDWGDGPRSTPTVDGDFVYALTGRGIAACVRRDNGDIVWKRDFVSDFGGGIPSWGYTESLLVDGDKVLGTPGGGGGAIVALNKADGEVLWRSTDFTEGAQYSSIVPADHGGRHQYIQLTSNVLVGLDSQTGQTLWRTDWPGRVAVIPTPIYDNGYVYITSGYGVGCKLVKLGDGGSAENVYQNQEMKNHHGGVIKLGGHVYGYSDGPGWICQDFLSGATIWNEKDGCGKGAIACADGMFYLQDEGSGKIVLIEATPEGWNERGSFTLEPQTQQRKPNGRIWTHPTIANGKLYLRDQELLFCFDVAAQ